MKHTQSLRRFGSVKFKPDGVKGLRPDHPAIVEGRPLFASRVVPVESSPRVLVSGHNNRKIGKKILKGEWAGMPIYTVTLAERTTCPRQCFMFERCYGDAMHWARRHEHGRALEEKLAVEVAQKSHEHHSGFAVRLHVLGDFYSPEYVRFWMGLLHSHKELHVWGYTARSMEHDPEIALAIGEMNTQFSSRCVIRWSGKSPLPGGATVFSSMEMASLSTVNICPAELHQTETCGTCGLCWSKNFRDQPIAFIEHGGVKKR